jgi:hypothetical protein
VAPSDDLFDGRLVAFEHRLDLARRKVPDPSRKSAPSGFFLGAHAETDALDSTGYKNMGATLLHESFLRFRPCGFNRIYR